MIRIMVLHTLCWLTLFQALAQVHVSGITNPWQSIKSDDVVAYYPLNGNANDESGYGNNGTSDSFIPVSNRFDESNAALYINGSNPVSIPSNTQLSFGSNDFTISFWFTLDDINRTHNGLIGRNDFEGISIEYNHDGDRKIIVFIDADGVPNWEMEWKIDFDGWEANKWYYIVLKRSGTSATFYINGEKKTSIAIEHDVNNPASSPFFIGRSQLTDRVHLGKMDEVTIYNRSLSDSEILSIYHAGGWDDLNYGLLAHYPFYGNSNDESVNSNFATNYGAALANDRFTHSNSAYLFDGTDDYLLIGDPVPYNLQIQNEITLSAWIYINQPPTEIGLIVGSQYDPTASGASIFIDNRTNPDGQTAPAGHIHFQIGNGSWHVTNSNSVVPTNQWVLITATRKANEDGKIYYNDQLQPSSSVAWDGSITYSNTWLAIGKQKDTERLFNGFIDDVRIYNRALTESEIQTLYSYTTPFVSIQSVNNITTNSAEFIGNVHDAGGKPIAARGFVWSTLPYPSLYSNEGIHNVNPETGEFSISINTLSPFTTYYVRAYATNSIGTAYGEMLEFRTLYEGDEFAGGNGSEEDPWLIETAQHLYNIRNYLGSENANKHFIQIADINLGVSPWNVGDGWEPIGSVNPENWNDPSHLPFTGNYSGEGFNISNLTSSKPTGFGVGLFGHVAGANLSNINIIDVNLNGDGFVGSVGGLIRNSSKVSNCYASGSVVANNEAGGIAGRIVELTEINGCYTSINVRADNYAGGIVGINQAFIKRCKSYSTIYSDANGAYFGGVAGKSEGTADESLSESTVYGYDNTGGITGYNTGNILNCFSTGSVQGNQYVGGFVGITETGTITNCYSTGSVTGNSNAGGFIATLISGDVVNSYWNTQTSGLSTSAGGQGRTTDQMTSPYDETTYVDWDFNLIWGEDFDYTINNGYPYLRMQDYDPPLVVTFGLLYATSHTAMVSGEVTNDNGMAVTDRGFIWDTDPSLELEWENYSGLIYCGEGIGEFSGILQPLSPSTTYYYRAFAISAAGYGYSEVLSFTTLGVMDLCLALDNCELQFNHGGDTNWFGQTITTHDGLDAAQSGYLGDNSNSNFYSTITGPGQLSFYWKASSEQESDMLQFFVNDEMMDGISGETGWEYMEYSINEGTFTLKWQFTKDESSSEGQDCGWVDRITYQQEGTPEVSACGESNVTATSANLCGEVIDEGSAEVTDRGVVWGITPEISINSNLGIVYEGGTGTGTFDVQAAGLTPSTTYYYKAFAINSIGVGYSDAESFTTETVANLYFVNQANGNDANDGKSWANAFATIQMALDAAVPQESQEIEIWVAAGTYTPTSTYGLGSDQELRHFRLKNNVALYGGFNGTETTVDERDWVNNETILSGDLNGDDYWNGEMWENIGDNCFRVFYHPEISLDNSAIIDGFTIQNGMARQQASNATGGGICNNGNTSPTICNITFKNNYALWGGGALYNAYPSEPIIINCKFISNYADGQEGGGGGAVLNSNSVPVFINSIFQGNTSASVGGAVWEAYGSSSIYINCLFINNSCPTQGGAITNHESSPAIINSTFVGNSPYGVTSGTNSFPSMVNCVLWNNSQGQINDFNGSQTDITYSNIQGGFSGDGNINEDPQFIDPSNGDYSLAGSSLCINAGTNQPFEAGQIADGITIDLGGNQRIFGSVVDIGAYEYQGLPSNLPVVNTNPVTGITHNSAVCGGNVMYDNGFAVTQRGVILGTEPNTTFDSENFISTENGSGTGEFTSTITSLDMATTYYIRAYATNQVGTGYGDEYEFRTFFASLENITADPDYNSAYISFAITSDEVGATYWVKYSTDPEMSTSLNTTEYVIFTTETIYASFYIQDLQENTVYYFQVVLKSEEYTSITDIYSFRTLCSYTIFTTTPSGPISVCAGDESIYTTSSDNAEEYIWQIKPSNAGTIENNGNSVTVQWSDTYSGNATIEVFGTSGSCANQSSELAVEVILNVSDITISGETLVCNQSRVIYSLNRDAVDYTWQFEGASVIESSSKHALVEWNQSGNKSVRVVEQATTGCPSQSTIDVAVSVNTAPTVPVIHRKGNINILICTTPLMDYKWFFDNQELQSQTKQYYVARNNLGTYNVQIKNSSQCPNTSDSYLLNTYTNAEQTLTIYPNPTSGDFVIETESEVLGRTRISISDTFGKVIYSEWFDKTDFFLSKHIANLHLTKGLYIVTLVVESEITKNAKFTVY